MMCGIEDLIERYKHVRSVGQLKRVNKGKYAFVGMGGHSTSNLYPVLDYLRVPLKYICCKSHDKARLIGEAYPGVQATTSLGEILDDDEVNGVFVAVSPKAHFAIASEVIGSGKHLFVEKPPCSNGRELERLIDLRKQAGEPTVVVGLQKRCAPAMRVLKKELQKSGGGVTYNLRYLTGAYPEGDALLDLYIHPLDCVSFLFGKAEIKCVESGGGHTLMLVLRHENATGVLELSTGYSWCGAKESLTVNTIKGIYELEQMEQLSFVRKPGVLAGVPIEKICRRNTVTTELFGRNNFLPTTVNNQIYTQGYFDTIKGFVDAVEGRPARLVQTLEALTDTYCLLDGLRRQ